MDREAALRAGYGALNRRDFDALLKLFDSKVEFGDEVVAVVRERGTGSGSAVSVDQLTYHVFMFQGEKVVFSLVPRPRPSAGCRRRAFRRKRRTQLGRREALVDGLAQAVGDLGMLAVDRA